MEILKTIVIALMVIGILGEIMLIGHEHRYTHVGVAFNTLVNGLIIYVLINT